ncbi:hypothetical protein BDQ17DRAFT_1491860 [Cyathus striatus]|nr:hypothetical protein BDQ17DRAFT_1491860 [Cyathus striatus]
MHNGTWHDSTSIHQFEGPLNATFTFNGIAIYVFCAISLSNTIQLIGSSYMTFYIDKRPLAISN